MINASETITVPNSLFFIVNGENFQHYLQSLLGMDAVTRASYIALIESRLKDDLLGVQEEIGCTTCPHRTQARRKVEEHLKVLPSVRGGIALDCIYMNQLCQPNPPSCATKDVIKLNLNSNNVFDANLSREKSPCARPLTNSNG